jgi:hypothetical protein
MRSHIARCLACLPALLATLAAQPTSAQRAVSERFAVAADVNVRIQNIAGSVKVVGWDRDSIDVAAKVHDTPTERFAIHHSDAGVRIGLWDPAVESVQPSHFEVRVPAGASVWVRTGSAAVFVSGVRGVIDVVAVGGAVEVRGAPREVFAESMTGAVVIDVKASVARAKTVSAPIRFHGAITDAAATSISGNVLIENADIQRGSFETVDGELRLVAPVRRGAALTFVTHAGAIEFLLPAATSAELLVRTYAGSLHSEFAAPIRTTASKLKGGTHSVTLGGGDARLDVRTFRGRVVVRSRQ